MDRKQKLEQISYKTNVRMVKNTDRNKLIKEDVLQQDNLQHDKALFETLGQYLSSNIKGGMTYWRQQYLELKAMSDQHGLPNYFVTLSMNDEWKELQNILSGLENKEDINKHVKHFVNCFQNRLCNIKK